MTDLRKAAEMALEFVEWFCGDDHSVKPKNNALKTREALRQALAQPEQEPEWVATIGNWGKVQWREAVFPQLGAKLYSAPPKKEWVELTDEEMRELTQKAVDDGMTRIVTDFEYIRSIEAKLRERNGG